MSKIAFDLLYSCLTERTSPLDGVAMVPSGSTAPGGEVLRYDSEDLMVRDGFKRWPGVVSASLSKLQ